MSDGHHILVVDDQPFNLSLIRRALEQAEADYRLSMVANGFKALDLIATDPPDLVILDVMMPKLDGFEACRRLKSDPETAEIPVILLTALTDVQSRIRGINAGADEFISKPFNKYELQARVRSLLRWYDAHRQLREEHKRLAAILNHTEDAIVVSDPDGRLSLFNPAAERLLGLEGSGACDSPWRDTIQDANLRSFFEQATQLKSTDVLEIATTDGKILHASVSPLEEMGTVIVLHDITLSKEVDRMRLRAEKIEKQRLRQTLRRYVGPELFDRVLSQEQGLLERRERLDAVVMFADLRGFTRMTSQLSPDTIVHILNGFFIEMAQVVHSTNGTVFNLIGDEMMIGFGVPLPQPDAADRALQTAVAMHRRFAELSDNWRQFHNIVLGLGIGLNKGAVVVGNVGSPNHMQYTMVGDTVNMAHRLVEMAARHEIVLSQSVLDGLSGPVETLSIERLPPTAIKGKEGLHSFYRVIT